MMSIHWTVEAIEDMQEIFHYVWLRNPAAAHKLRQRLEASVLPLSEHPYLYRRSERIPGLREIVAHPSYIVFYRVTESRIEVVNVVHTSRQFPPLSV